MTRYGYTLMTEQSGPKELVSYAAAAEQAGFDFLVSSDHYFPWLDSMGHSPYAWSMLGAVAHVTDRVELMTYVTCPTLRYHPAIVAQKAATLGVMSDNRFILGLGSGENLNEHVVGHRWPAVAERQDMLAEATVIIGELLAGNASRTTFDGQYFRVDSAKVWDLPDQRVEIAMAVSGEQSIKRFAPLGDHLIAVAPDASAIDQWDAEREGMAPSRKIGQIPICWGPDKDAAVQRAHEMFRWFAGGWKVNADLPTDEAFAAATQFVRPQDVADNIACGPDLDELAEAIKAFPDAGFTDVALVQIGDESQEQFCAEIAPALLEKLR